ncbi:MAG: hypothetical protein JNJ58_05680 [Chitinophagaceae bacterium]|nr:hypothetical protein [Chitinophagaceae bacterium]
MNFTGRHIIFKKPFQSTPLKWMQGGFILLILSFFIFGKAQALHHTEHSLFGMPWSQVESQDKGLVLESISPFHLPDDLCSGISEVEPVDSDETEHDASDLVAHHSSLPFWLGVYTVIAEHRPKLKEPIEVHTSSVSLVVLYHRWKFFLS